MQTSRHRNATYGFVYGLKKVLGEGKRLQVRGSEVLELRNHLTIIDQPRERCIITPRRNNNIFATVAESVWVMAGRNDLDYLSYYLPKASDFSDDSKTWRGGYGPRLRNWYGVDQFSEIRRILRSDPNTRRAVMTLFDPAVDTRDSKDIPCNNWLDWIIRDGKLHASIALRSNDAVWGFSGINSFEWSLLQEMMAYWIGVDVGDVSYMATSFHVYAHHEQRARDIVEHFPRKTWYEIGSGSPGFATDWEKFDAMLTDWFAIESRLRVSPETGDREIEHIGDPLFKQFLALIQLYCGIKHGWDNNEIAQRLSQLTENDLTAAAYEYISRNRPDVLTLTSGHSKIKRWLATLQDQGLRPQITPAA